MNFELEWHERRIGSMQTPRRFLDYVVDGASLYERLGADFITPLGWLSPEEDEQAAQRLLRKNPPDVDDRVALYICPEDADLLCGAVTATIVREGEEIVWRHLAMSYFDWPESKWYHDSTEYSEWGELRFPATSYYQAIADRPKDPRPRD